MQYYVIESEQMIIKKTNDIFKMNFVGSESIEG